MNVPFYRWHPEVALRYLPIVDEIREGGDTSTILEVGSAGLGIVPYLGRSVTGIDIEFTPPFHPLLTRVKGSALKLPFDSSSFDIVLSADTLEHISPKDRNKTIGEMLRVAKQKVIIAVPCGPDAQKQDNELDQEYFRRHKKHFHFLEEQVNFGLPEEQELREAIKRSGSQVRKRVEIEVNGNENLDLRKFLMHGWMSDNIIINILHRKVFLLFIPFFRRMNQKPAYRRIFFIDIVR